MTDVFASHMRHEESGDDAASHRHHHALVEAVAEGDADRASALVRSIFDPFMH
jgi:DNA-binding GntR family transcriptional regulator